jgi:rubrerythrin
MKTILGMGKNRTGAGTSPIDSKDVAESATEGAPFADGDGAEIAGMRADYVRIAEPIGSVPPPTTLKGAVKTAGQAITGKNPTVLIDLLSERLAFERTGTRLYEAIIAKIEASEDRGDVDLAQVRRFHDEEHEHVALVTAAIERLGGDPTVQTPMADLDGVAAMGILQIITDPRTSVLQSLHALHIAELADNDGWVMLIDLAERMGHEEMARSFDRALADEREHLAHVRRWCARALADEAGVESAPAP